MTIDQACMDGHQLVGHLASPLVAKAMVGIQSYRAAGRATFGNATE